MKKIIAILLICGVVQAETPYALFYVNSSGKKLDTAEALLKSVNGETVYKCQSVEAKVSKAGTSIGLHNIKKPKTETK